MSLATNTTATTWLRDRSRLCDATTACRHCVTIADLLADDATVLRRVHATVSARRNLAPVAAATHIAAWYAGGVAGLVGTALAVTGASLQVTTETVHWTIHPNGWPSHTSLTSDVRAEHERCRCATTGRAIVVHVDDRTVATLVDTMTPLVEALHELTRASRDCLWNEVGDGLVTHLPHLVGDRPVTPYESERVMRLAAAGPPPWRAFQWAEPQLRAV